MPVVAEALLRAEASELARGRVGPPAHEKQAAASSAISHATGGPHQPYRVRSLARMRPRRARAAPQGRCRGFPGQTVGVPDQLRAQRCGFVYRRYARWWTTLPSADLRVLP